ncbi:MAG: phosphoribosylformylglycinamidine synthase subunit PurL [Candidatus Omnitrophota bacterium]|jgi:phosphoribosylformylglycinamidine synthase|nr:MAG: phosphoribosylformylglycinamidine synthase subunit PurL [Candidatus Omnitrophota bacterium]
MFWVIEVKDKPGIFDAIGAGVKKDILDLGIKSARSVGFSQIYIIEGNLLEEEINRISECLLVDPIVQDHSINDFESPHLKGTSRFVIYVAYNPGVMDPAEASIMKGIADLRITRVRSVKTAKKYCIEGKLTDRQLAIISEKLLYNKLIQHIVKSPAAFLSHESPVAGNKNEASVLTVDLLRASDTKLKQISAQGQLFLSLQEMRQIKHYFQGLKRNPTDCELETIAQTWSEHCQHKTFRGKIKYCENHSRPVMINDLLKATIIRATKELNKSWCVSVFQDNAGIIKFDEKHNICFKVETHNHPSALEPFGGANTGVGGVIRDCLGTGLGAKPVCNTDIFCFAPYDYPLQKLPAGTLHPKRIMKGVVAGVRDYGNKMGIPTVNGAILFHEQFIGNPLVYCGTVGILPKEKSFKEPLKRDAIVLVGGATGRDGIHGATFSSGELTHNSENISSGSVQIGNPIEEKKILDTILKARDLNLYNAITDCGAGGLSSAVGEMGKDLGAKVELCKVPLKYRGLSYTEIWISESQERMVLSVPQNKLVELLEVFRSENVRATPIGEFTDTQKLQLYYKGNLVCNLDMHFLHEGSPRPEKKAVFVTPRHKENAPHNTKNLTPSLKRLLGHPDICSKEWVIRQYDHEVQGGSVLRPLCGVANDGPSDAAIIKPLLHSPKGVIVSNGINFRFGFIDPYWMAASCIDEALRQIIAVGGSLKNVALLDNFCWGNPDKPDRLGGLVRAALGCYDAAKGFGVPFISGKDSLNNEYTVKNKSLAIPGTLLISAIAVMEDASGAVSMYLKEPGNLLYVVGGTAEELGASHYYDLSGIVGNNVPKVYPKKARQIFEVLSRASSKRLVRAMHDCAEGGIAVALAEMAFAGGLGAEAFLKEVPLAQVRVTKQKAQAPRNDFVLFSESNSRFIVEVERAHQKEFERCMRGIPFGLFGCVSQEKQLKIFGLDGQVCIEAGIAQLKEAWQAPLRW